MSIFRIRFEGLVAPVPKRAQGDAEKPSEVLMVLPNLRLPQPMRVGSVDDTKFAVRSPTHLPCLVVEERYVVPPSAAEARSSKQPELVFERDNRRYAVFAFDRENLSFDLPEVQDFDYFEQGLEGEAPDEHDPDQEHDLRWVPSLARSGLPGAEVFDRSSVLARDVPRAGRGLIGTVTLRRGRFQTAEVRRDPPEAVTGIERVTLFPFQTVGSPPESFIFRQAVASATENVLDIAEDTLKLVWLQRPARKRTLVIRSLEDSGSTPLRILNRELEAIVGIGEVTPSPTADWDTDPAVFYRLSKFRDRFAGSPLPVARAQGVGRGTPGCDATGFESWA